MDKNTPSDCIGNYNVKYLIGRGSFGNVYKASAITSGQEVAIKFIGKKHLNDKSGLRSRVLQEVSIHSRLKHPCILELLSYFEDEHYIYLVLELCCNGDLNNKLKQQPSFFTDEKIRRYMTQLVEGLLYLQRHRILHRDLTLSNLLLDQQLNIKICDFGLATRLQDDNDKHFTMCGTPNYISPEVATRQSHGLEADVWSVGCLLFTMVTGTPPFHSQLGVKNTLHNVVHAGLVIPKDVNACVRDLIMCMLVKHPDQRIKLCEIPNHAFFNQTSPLHTPNNNEMDVWTDSGGGTLSTIHNNNNNNHSNNTNNNNTNNKNKHHKKRRSKEKHNPPPQHRSINSLSSDHGIGQSTALSTYHMQEPFTLQNLLTNKNTDLPKGVCLNDIMKPQSTNRNKPPSSFLNYPTNNNRPRSRSVEQTTNKNAAFSDANSFRSNDKNLNPFHQSMSNVNNNNVISHNNNNNNVISHNNNVISHNNNNNNVISHNNNNNNVISHNNNNIISHNNNNSCNNLNSINNNSILSNNNTIISNQQNNRHQHTQLNLNNNIATKTLNNNIATTTLNNNIATTTLNTNIGPPLNAHRLIPIRQKTRNAVVNILSDGWVCVEFIKCFASEDYVTEVMFVSVDGMKIIVVNCSKGKEIKLKAQEPVISITSILHTSTQAHKQYTYTLLPSKYAKKYQYALRFVNLVRSKTPKVTLYTARAKVMLMENQPIADFEAHFYDGMKVTITNNSNNNNSNNNNTTTTRIVEKGGGMLLLEAHASVSALSLEVQNNWMYACKMQDRCLKLESLLESFQSDMISSSSDMISSSSSDSCFPVVIGRRPSSISSNSKENNNNNNNNNKNNFHPSSNSSFSLPIKSSPLSVNSYSSSEASSHNKEKIKNKKVEVSDGQEDMIDRMTSHNILSDLTNVNNKLFHTKHNNNNLLNNKNINHANINNTNNNTNNNNTNNKQMKNMHSKHLNLPNIGDVYQYANGLVTIKHVNGCLATLNSNTLDVSIATPDGGLFSYSSKDQIPSQFNPLLQNLPSILSSLQQA